MRIIIFLTALFFSASAWADNIKQKDTGATVWENSSGVQYSVGNGGLTVTITDISSALTYYVVSHKPGVIAKIYGIINGLPTGSAGAVLSFRIGSNGQYAPISSGGNTLTLTGTTHGSVSTYTPSTDVTVAGKTVGQGEAIAIVNSGAATDTNPATITIVIE